MSSNRSTPDRGNDAAATNSDVPHDANSSSSKPSIRKDRNCPFCRQPFTSSSLGRHLDSFIRDKSPKPHDGVHDPQKIRKMRENITRRHTRVPAGAVVDNSSRRWSVTSIVSPRSGSKGSLPLSHKPSLVGESSTRPQGYEATIPQPGPNWMVTGVINNLPPRVNQSPLPRILPRPETSLAPGTQAFGSVEDMDDARAANQALREVLHIVKTAAASAVKPTLFDFDFRACNFPALCIRILQAPAALFSSTPLPAPLSWPLGVPSQMHLTELQERLRQRIATFHAQQEEGNAGFTSTPDSRRQSHANIFYQGEFKSLFDHLELAFQHWQNLPEPQKHEIWHLEMLRAYAQEAEQRQSMQSYVIRLQEEAETLRAQMEEFRSKKQTWQQTVPMDVPRPFPISLSKNIVQAITKGGVDLDEWDYDKLIARHRPSVQRARRQSASGTNDIRTAHERALSNIGPSDSMLLRPMIGAHGASDGQGGDTPISGQGGSDRDDDSQDGDGEFDADVDMEDGPSMTEGGSARITNRQRPG